MPVIHEVLAALPHHAPGDRDAYWFTSDTYYPLYARIGEIVRPASVLEYGTRLGYSLIALAHGSRQIERFCWVDNECGVPGSNALATQNLASYYERQLPGVDLTAEFHPTEAGCAGQPFDLVHIDGEHTFAAVCRQLQQAEAARPRCILVDDWCSLNVRRAVLTWAELHVKSVRVFEAGDAGLAVIDLMGRELYGRLFRDGWRVVERIEW